MPIKNRKTSGLPKADKLHYYVVGFLFKDDDNRVLVIRKVRPEWQRGKLNGIGGKIKVGETPEAAMEREFLEEAGIRVSNWRKFCCLTFDNAVVHFFRATWDGKAEPRALTDELIFWKATCIFDWPTDSLIPNLSWLIPLAKDSEMRYFVMENPLRMPE